jgi:N-succinyl-L-ornithine transcarbamylase
MLTGADLGSAAFMHCLPVRRGVVVADEVLDGGRSLVLEQAAARLDVQKATLCRALGAEA